MRAGWGYIKSVALTFAKNRQGARDNKGLNDAAGLQDSLGYLRLQAVLVFVRDQERSLRFYVDKLGLGAIRESTAPPSGAATVTQRLPDSRRTS